MRLKIIAAVLALSTALTPVPARAEPISFAIVAGTAWLQGTIGLTATSLLIGAAKFAAGALVSSLVGQALAQDAPTPPPQEVQSNFAVEIPPRYMAYGVCRIGGSLQFAELKGSQLYKLVAQCDSEVTEEIQYYLNDNPVTLDADNWVTQEEFQTDEGHKKFRIYTRAGTVNQPAMALLRNMFPEWTAQHVGAGVSDTLLRISGVDQSKRHQIYRHRGVLGLGEPDVSRVARYGRVYDPRLDGTQPFGTGPQRRDDTSTWGPADGNLALMIATHRLDPERFAMHPDDINWENIAQQANYCDLWIEDRYGQQVRKYHGAVLINKNEETNLQSENKMLAACDGIRFEDEEGRFGIHVGHFYEPMLVLRDEDIFEIASSESDDGETSFTHLYGKYTEPEFDWKAAATAPWVNSDIWSEGRVIRNKEVPLYEVQHHNHAVRLLKAAGKKSSAKLQLQVLAGLRAKRARSERFLRIESADLNLSGVYEIIAVQRPEDRLTVPLTLMKLDGDHWNLLPGEEGPRPNFSTSVEIDTSIQNIVNADMDITVEAVQTSNGVGARLKAVFPVPAREDRKVEIQHRRSGETTWLNFAVTTDEGTGASGIVADGSTQEVRWRVVGMSGKSSGYNDPPLAIVATADTDAPGDLINPSATIDGSDVEMTWTAPNSRNFEAVRIYRNNVDDITTATQLATVYHAPSSSESYTDADLAAGSYWFWLVPVNGSGWPGNTFASGEVTIV